MISPFTAPTHWPVSPLFRFIPFVFFFYLLCQKNLGCAKGGMAVATATAVSLPGSATMTRLSGELSRAGANFPRLHVPRTHFLQTRCLGKMATFRSSNSKQTHHKIPFAYGKENVNEDTDDMFDELFHKYGKVVFRRNDKRPSANVDDDAESLSFAVAMAKVASEVKAADIKVLFVKPLVYWTRFFIIATAFSRPQIDAIGSRIRDLAEKKYGKVPSGDSKPNSWTLLDFGDVVIHIFLPQQREFYNLEEFYGNATRIELPFENQPPFRP